MAALVLLLAMVDSELAADAPADGFDPAGHVIQPRLTDQVNGVRF
ncbi:hypothetical protein OG417_22740 [Actinoallomurus sp. NBC_01490]|jgi:hypothetical protein|nr:hypothetical protein [Actinoallomurus sp. NBC_01490]